jgi:hypothetical protein
MLEVDPAQALAFRVAGHNLHERTDPLTAVAACGLQEYPPGWSAVALHARAQGEPDDSEVVMVNAMRGAPHVVPRAEAAVFTAALVPEEDGIEHFIGRENARAVAREGHTPREALDLIVAAARDGLAGGPLDRDAFHQALRERLPDTLLPWCEGCQSHHVAPGMWRALGPLGVIQMPARATFALADYPAMPPADARRELARRFLRCYGPATPRDLAAWGKTSPAHAKALFGALELEPARVGDREGWILAEDRARLENPPRARGVRLLGGFDPYVVQRDRDTLVPDPALRKRLFAPVGRPGIVLHDGVFVGLWRGRKGGDVLRVEVEWIADPVDVSEEAEAVARLRGCSAAELTA